MPRLTHCILLRAVCADLPGALLARTWAEEAAQAGGFAVHAVRMARSQSAGQLYAYVEMAEPKILDKLHLQAIRQTLHRAAPELSRLEVSRLEQVFDTPGASAGAGAARHYVVETDPEDGWFDELSRWYDEEHMPGLARVPGCIRASRYLNRDAGPLSLACYDLVTEDTLGSPPWLAVRHTDWSSRVRPHFTNTRRTMFEQVAHLAR